MLDSNTWNHLTQLKKIYDCVQTNKPNIFQKWNYAQIILLQIICISI